MSFHDPQWGRSSGQKEDPKQSDEAPRSDDDRGNDSQHRQDDDRRREHQRGANSDLDQLWDDFNRTIGALLGGAGSRRTQRRPDYDHDLRDDHENDPFAPKDDERRAPEPNNGNNGDREPPRFTRAKKPQLPNWRLAAMAVGAAAIAWAASGIYIVPEGQVGVVTTFGRYTQDSAAGINWRLPWPIQEVEIVDVSSVRKAEIGIRGAQRLSEALMLTDDENIVDVMFNVQYRIKPHQAKDFLFRSRDPDQSVVGAAESAMREVVGRKTMDSVLFESKQEIAENVRQAMQQMLDRYETGIEVMSVAIQNAQPPQQVQAAFNDAVKAGQDRERQINEGQAYANAVIPAARGLASRLVQEAEGYKARVVETATGDAERFGRVLDEYEKAPKVTRDRIYIDAMRDIYAATKKVLVNSTSGSNLLYLPFEKLLEQSAQAAQTQTVVPQAAASASTPASAPAAPAASSNIDDPRTYLRQRAR